MKVCREYGAHLAINYKEENFAEEVLSFTANKGTCIAIVAVFHIQFFNFSRFRRIVLYISYMKT